MKGTGPPVSGSVFSTRQHPTDADPRAHPGRSGVESANVPPMEVNDTEAAPSSRSNDPTAPRMHIHARWTPAKPTKVFDTYWRFAAERQSIFFRRFEGASPPWTKDAILKHYKFTNVYRAADRVSQYLIRNVIYMGSQSPREVFFRILLFKVFNRIETWERLVAAFGNVNYEEYRYKHYDRVLTEALDAGMSIYSAAYIMPTGGARAGGMRKHQMHLRLIDRMIADSVPERIAEARSMQSAFELLRGYPTIGDFLAYQYVTDLNYSTLTSFTEREFVVPGPGARDGIRKCFHDLGGLNEAEVIRYVADGHEQEFEKRGLAFRALWGRPLQFIDCQNLFCEVDKYARVHHPDVIGRTGRTRIKQKFGPNLVPLPYWFPPKWGINDRIEREPLANPPDGSRGQKRDAWEGPCS